MINIDVVEECIYQDNSCIRQFMMFMTKRAYHIQMQSVGSQLDETTLRMNPPIFGGWH